MSKNESFGVRLKTVREAANMSLREVGIALGYSPGNSHSIRSVESGELTLSEDKLAKIIELFPVLADAPVNKDLRTQFGVELRRLREEAGMSMSDLAEVAGYASSSGINNIELGNNGCSKESYKKISKALPAIKKVPTPPFRGKATLDLGEEQPKEPRSIDRVKRVQAAARNLGEPGAAPKKERMVPWAYTRNLLALLQEPQLKAAIIAFLRAAHGNGMSLRDILNDLESI